MNIHPLSTEKLSLLCQDLRRFIIDCVATHGGHLGASLGVIELTVAIHHAFDLPLDKLIWDVGHQAYAHKILTGRKDIFYSNRKWNGISGFPSRKESIYDDFGTGHSSTSISAILGMAVAAQLSDDKTIQNRWHIAVIGDGAFTAGLPFEALNNAASIHSSKVLLVLNDNGMSIDENVGTLKTHFQQLATYEWNAAQEHNFTSPSTFDFFGTTFHGSIDGHDIKKLLSFFEYAQNTLTSGVHIIHVRTVKGKGIIENASVAFEKQYNAWHAPSKFEPQTGRILPSSSHQKAPKFQDVFGATLLQLASQNSKIVAITPAMASGSSLLEFQRQHPTRCFDVGIAEQHAVTFSAGLAAENLLPFCVIYSTFLQRAYDQLIHDVCVQDLKVVFCIDRAGLVGADGATHQGVYDIAFLRTIPNLILAAPMDEKELQHMLYTASLEENQQSFAIRYPRGNGFHIDWKTDFEKISIGKGRILTKDLNAKIAVLSYGITGNFVQETVQELDKHQISIIHVDMRFAKPLDEELLHQLMPFIETIVTIEDGAKIGGFGSAISEWLHKHQYQKHLYSLGVPDEIIPHGLQQEQYVYCGIDPTSILKKLLEIHQNI